VTAETFSLGMLGALAVSFICSLLGAPQWAVFGALGIACLLGIAAFAFALFPPRDC
jgi:hypothetical protein